MSFDPDDILRALRKAWSPSTASKWTTENPAAGQCNVTSLLIHELFGGEKTPLPAGRGGAGSNTRRAGRTQSRFSAASYQVK